ncbi:GNAT family N-acetyltransferase [Clostridium sp. AL.422]|uniref:GNAT family N-acetyltransferase n=1 Tax=Clostridium TaxID=1485 RepID=UPI00293DA67E|nr:MULTISPECIES: GNAT family N-acetyltransferase [unclassified Clostridium]MDV4152219.1 GNAT family N-acetyltransferase [Clostridium sp. AL.422]
MEYEIKPLTPELHTIFTDYLENLDFGHAPHWSTCFCRFYHTNCSQLEWQKRAGIENRTEAIEEIKAEKMKGYLAFDGDKCIGWCNANDVRQFLRLEEDLKHITNDKKIGCAICFVIHPEYRKQGIARQLFKKAIEDFKLQNFDAVIGLPIDTKESSEKHYRGTMNMYKEFGFEVIEKQDDVSVMWLKL